MKNCVFILWNDAYQGFHQFLCDSNNQLLFERWRSTERVELRNGSIMNIGFWTSWIKVDPPNQMEKAWFVREMSIEDLVLGNYDEEKIRG